MRETGTVEVREWPIFRTLEIGGKSSGELLAELKGKGFRISNEAQDMLESREFEASKIPQDIDLVRLTIGDLGFDPEGTTDQIYKRAQELGLDSCPAEVGPHLRLAYTSQQPVKELLLIGMKQIPDSHGYPRIFILNNNGESLWLHDFWVPSHLKWNAEHKFVFSLRPRLNQREASK